MTYNDCKDCATPGTVTARKAVTIKVKVIALIPSDAAEGAYEAVAQKAVTDALLVGGALIESASSKTKSA